MKLKKNGFVHRFAYGDFMGAPGEKPVKTNRCELFWLCMLQLLLIYPMAAVVRTIHAGISYTVCPLFAGYLIWKNFGTSEKEFHHYEKWPRLWGRRIYPIWLLLFAAALRYWQKATECLYEFFHCIYEMSIAKPVAPIGLGILLFVLAVLLLVIKTWDSEVTTLIRGFFSDLKNKLCTTVEFVDEIDLNNSKDT